MIIPVNRRKRRTITHIYNTLASDKYDAASQLADEIKAIIKAEFEILQIIPVGHGKKNYKMAFMKKNS